MVRGRCRACSRPPALPAAPAAAALPGQCNALEGLHTLQVACGVGFTLFLARPHDKLGATPVYEPSVATEESRGGAAAAAGDDDSVGASKGGAKRKGGGGGGGGRGKKAK